MAQMYDILLCGYCLQCNVIGISDCSCQKSKRAYYSFADWCRSQREGEQ